MNFAQARVLAQQIATSMNLIHSHVDALKEALIIGRPIDADDVNQLAAKLDSLHALLGTADKEVFALFNRLYTAIRVPMTPSVYGFAAETSEPGAEAYPNLPVENGGRLASTLSGGTPKD